jgi:hypothetical protein
MQATKRGPAAMGETRLKGMTRLAAPSKRKKAAGEPAKKASGAAAAAPLPMELPVDYSAGIAAVGAGPAAAATAAGSRSKSASTTSLSGASRGARSVASKAASARSRSASTTSRSRSRSGGAAGAGAGGGGSGGGGGGPVALSPTRLAAGTRLAGMLKRVLAARNVAARAEDMRLVRENMRSRLVVEGKRKGRGQRTAPRLQEALLRENAAGLALDELEQVLESAEQYISSRESATGLSADEARAVRQDVAMASLLFQGRADRSMNSKERKQLDALAGRLAPAAMRTGEHGLSAAMRRIRGLFGARVGPSELRRRLLSFLGGSAALRELEGVLASTRSAPASAEGAAALSASRSSEVGRRARAAVLKAATAAGSRSGDEAEAGTSTRSFIASQAGSLRSARASTKTSSKSARTMTRSSERSAVAVTPEAPLARRLPARAARGKAPERFGVAEAAVLALKDVTKRFLKAKAGERKGEAGAAKALHDLRVEFFVGLMQTLPGRLSEEQRRELDKMVHNVFAGRERAAREAAVDIFAHKSAASMLRSPDKRRLRDLLARIMTASELESVQNEFDWISSVSRGSQLSSAAGRGSRRVQSEPALFMSRLGSFSIDQSAVWSEVKPRFTTLEALDRLRSLVRGARAQKRKAGKKAAAGKGARARSASGSGGSGSRSSSSASTWLKRANARRAAGAAAGAAARGRA